MGVYINMEMPTRCGRCDMCIKEVAGDIDYHYECCITAAVIKNLGEKMVDCPLINVPPHGRLVDADRLLSEQMKRKYYHLPSGDTAIPVIDIEHAPTVIEKEEVYSQYTDTAGNFHWCGTHSGEHKIKAEEGE